MFMPREGDTLERIADDYDISPDELICFNRQLPGRAAFRALVPLGLGLAVPCPGQVDLDMCPALEMQRKGAAAGAGGRGGGNVLVVDMGTVNRRQHGNIGHPIQPCSSPKRCIHPSTNKH